MREDQSQTMPFAHPRATSVTIDLPVAITRRVALVRDAQRDKSCMYWENCANNRELASFIRIARHRFTDASRV